MSSPIINDKKDYVIKVNPRPAFHFHAEFSNKATCAKLSLLPNFKTACVWILKQLFTTFKLLSWVQEFST